MGARHYFLTILIIFSNSANCDNSITQLHIFFRHGERAPTETYKNDPYFNFKWSGGWGHLTNRGKLQMYDLGLKIREIYKDFIPEYYFNEDVDILSSYSDRCLMSAESFLAGLFPPKGEQIWNKDLLWQPIPVKYIPRNQDNLIACKRPCAKYDRELSTILKLEEYQKIDRKYEELYKVLTNNTGEDMNNIWKIEFLYNTLEIELLHNLTLPEWTKSVSFETLESIAAKSLASFTHTDYMKRMKGGVWLNRTIDCMRNNQVPIFYLYSGHDITLVNILRALGVVEDTLKPGFGATFIIELHKNQQVKMIYRNQFDGEPQEMLLASCRPTCLLADFERTLEQFLPKSWDDECRL